MNWPKFMKEFRIIAAWLDAYGCPDTNTAVIRMIAAIFRGCDAWDYAIAGVVTDRSASAGEAPDTVYHVWERWRNHLPRESRILGEIYERTSPGRRAQGVYYTPREVVDFVLQHTVATCDVVENPTIKILDPACGCGYFLLQAYDILWSKYRTARSKLTDRYPDSDWSDDGIHTHILQHNLWGADIDPVAAEITAVSLCLKHWQTNREIKPNILVCDSLKKMGEAKDAAKDKQFWSNQYDFVVGNPPYLSFGLRGLGRLASDYADSLRAMYKESAEYKLSYYVLFMQRGIEMLTPGGKLGFIVPDSFLLGRYFSKIRRYILETTAIEILAHITAPVFKSATVGMSAVCVLTKEEKALQRNTHIVAVYQARCLSQLEQATPACRYPQSYFSSLPHSRFRLFFDCTAKCLIDKLDAISLPLAQFATGHTGARSLTKQNDIIFTSPQGPLWRRGLISGRQVFRYGIEYQGHWLHIDPSKLYKGGWQPEIISQRKILVRQTGYSLTAGIDEQGYYHLNNIHSFVLRDDSVTLEYLLLLLNSRLLAFYYHVTSMEYGRAMAQTDIETLELLPFRIHPDINEQAPGLVKAMINFVQRRQQGDMEAEGKITAMDEYFNQLVYRIYELTDTEIAYVEEYERKLAALSTQSSTWVKQ
jgi:hypothetical protein